MIDNYWYQSVWKIMINTVFLPYHPALSKTILLKVLGHIYTTAYQINLLITWPLLTWPFFYTHTFPIWNISILFVSIPWRTKYQTWGNTAFFIAAPTPWNSQWTLNLKHILLKLVFMQYYARPAMQHAQYQSKLWRYLLMFLFSYLFFTF